jgi:hypothetical protein
MVCGMMRRRHARSRKVNFVGSHRVHAAKRRERRYLAPGKKFTTGFSDHGREFGGSTLGEIPQSGFLRVEFPDLPEELRLCELRNSPQRSAKKS